MIPTRSINFFASIFLHINAASGAAITPPTIKPSMTLQVEMERKMINVTVWASVTKNSDELTDPIVVRAEFPLATSVVVTIGPHPPPPSASINPPMKPRTNKPLPSSFGWMWNCLNTLKMIVIPMISR